MYRPYAHDVRRHYVISETGRSAVKLGSHHFELQKNHTSRTSSLVYGERITRRLIRVVTLDAPIVSTKTGLSFYRFPVDPDRRSRWLTAVKRENWQPNVSSWVCRAHFVSGKKDDDPLSPDYVPSCIQVLLIVLRILPLTHQCIITVASYTREFHSCHLRWQRSNASNVAM